MILSVLNFYHGSSGSDGQSEPLHPGPTGPGGQIAARAAFELVEQGARALLVSVDLPGPIHVDVNKTRLTLQTGQGVFINSGALHAVEPAEGRALLHSGVFQPRLVGGMDTVFWQKLIRPLLQPGTPPFFLLDEAVPWQRQVLLCLREAWKGVADEPFDYENRVRYHLTAALRLLITQCVSGKVKVSEQEQIASERMKQMLRYVEEHYAEELTVEKLRHG